MSTFGDGVYQYGGAPVMSFPSMAMYAGLKKRIQFVDGDNGSDGNNGLAPDSAKKTIQAAVTASGKGGIVYVFPKAATDLAVDPNSYAETVIIPYTHANLTICGVGTGRTQGGLPQMKIATGSTAMIDVRAPGVTVMNMCINGASSTGGGIRLSDNGTDPATTATSFGFSAFGNYFKNCKCHSTHGSAGGAIYTVAGSSAPWQVLIENNIFFKNTGGIVVASGSASQPQDWVIRNNVFSSSVKTDVDVDIYIGTGGVLGLVIDGNVFATMDVPTKASGDVGRYIFLGDSNGIVSNNMFACYVPEDGTEVTMGAAGTACVIPATVKLSGNFGETDAAGASANTLDTGIVFRT